MQNDSIPLPTRDDLRPIAARLATNADDQDEIDWILDDMNNALPMDEDDVFGPDDDPHVPVTAPRPVTGEPYLPPPPPSDGFFAGPALANPPL